MKETPAFRTKVLNMSISQAIPEGVIEHLWVRRRRGIWNQLYPHQAHCQQAVGCSTEGKTRGKHLSRSTASSSLHQGAAVPIAQTLFRLWLSTAFYFHLKGIELYFVLQNTPSIFQNTPMPQAFHNLWRMGQILKLISTSWFVKTGRNFP